MKRRLTVSESECDNDNSRLDISSSAQSFNSKPRKIKNRKKLDDSRPIWSPKDHSTWDPKKQSLWKNIKQDPEAFYFQYCSPRETPRSDNWSESEINHFQLVLLQRPPKDEKWGLFSMYIPGRCGKQCRDLFYSMKSDLTPTSILIAHDKETDSVGKTTTDANIIVGFSKSLSTEGAQETDCVDKATADVVITESLSAEGAKCEEIGKIMTNVNENQESLHVESNEIGNFSSDLKDDPHSQESPCDEKAQYEEISEKSTINPDEEEQVVDSGVLENNVCVTEKDDQSDVDILLSTFSNEHVHSPSTSDTIENEDCIPSPPWSSDFDTTSHLQYGDISSKEDLWNDSLVIDEERCAQELSLPEKSFDPAEECVFQLKRISEKFDYDRKRLQEFYVRRIRECLLNPPLISREMWLKSANSWIDKFKQEQV